jgi:type II secretory pathway pseudopilin PulG
MKLYPHNLLADAKEERRQGERAFTMVEIAIAIGVIGFALVAVIGILPAGMSVQKDNREDTTISQDAPFFLDAIRNGSTNLTVINNGANDTLPFSGLDFLTNYVESISIISNYVASGTIKTVTTATFTNFGVGLEILGLLSTPEPSFVTLSNFTITRAIVRSLSGAAVQQNGANRLTAFRYQMDIEIVPLVDFAPDSTNYQFYLNRGEATNSPDVQTRYYRYLEANPFPSFTLTPQTITNLPYAVGSLAYSSFDVKMRFSWPVIDTGNGTYTVGPNHQTYRTTVSSGVQFATLPSGAPYHINGQQLWFFQPQSYLTQGYQFLR